MGSGGLKWSEPSLEQSDEALILEVIESANYGDYVRMRVSLREGRVKLTVPWKTKTAQLLEFMRGCCRWIRKNLDRQQQTMMQQANARSAYGAKIRPGGWVYLEGTRFALQPADVQSVEIDKSSSGQEPLLLMPSFSALPEPLAHKLQATFVSRFLKRRLCEMYAERAPQMCRAMHLFPTEFVVSQAQTSWGSCNAKGVVRLSWPLACLPVKYFDYVLVHELAHLAHMNHSRAFWSLVEEFCPNCRQTRKELRAIGLKSIFTDEILTDAELKGIFRQALRR